MNRQDADPEETPPPEATGPTDEANFASENLTDETVESEHFEDELFEDDEDDEEGFSLEELGAAYQHVVSRSESGEHDDLLQTGEVLRRDRLVAAQALSAEQAGSDPDSEPVPDDADAHDAEAGQEDTAVATPEAIIESALFVGQPNGQSITSARLASIMRDMQPEEVEAIIESLNRSYRQLRQGIRIAEDESGFRMVVAPEVESIRHVFTGKVRETRLAQPAVEVLALVAYQPGITAAECTDRRGRDSGPLLNQMVRRRLIEMKREPIEKSDAKKPKMVSRYYPAERLLVLLGLDSLEDLPQVEETHLA